MRYFIFLFIITGLNNWAAAETNWPGDSLYQIKSEWRDQNDKTVRLGDYGNKKVIIGMVYTGCAHACPMTISKIQNIEEALAKKGLTNYHVVLASFDVENDTPEHLKDYLKKRKLDAKRWSFLSPSNAAAVRELAVALGISFKDLGDGQFSHSNVISGLDEKGLPVGKVESLRADIEPLVGALAK